MANELKIQNSIAPKTPQPRHFLPGPLVRPAGQSVTPPAMPGAAKSDKPAAIGIPVAIVAAADPVAAPISPDIGAIIGDRIPAIVAVARRVIDGIGGYADSDADNDSCLRRRCGDCCRAGGAEHRNRRNGKFSERFHVSILRQLPRPSFSFVRFPRRTFQKTCGVARSCETLGYAARPRPSIAQIVSRRPPRTP